MRLHQSWLCRCASLLALSGTLVLSGPLGAQDPGSGDDMRARAKASTSARSGNAIALSLEQVIEMALRSNLDIAISRYSAQKGANSVIAEDAAFDPTLSSSGSHRQSTSPTGSTLDGASVLETMNSTYSAQVAQRLDYGANWSVTTNATRSSSNSSFSTLEPQYNTNLQLQYNQPLLRNFGRDAAKFNLRVAQNTRVLTDEGFRNQVMVVIEDAVKSYWDLVLAIEDLAVRQRSLELAQDLKRQNEIMVDVGTRAPIEITVAEAEVATRQEAIIVAKAALESAEDNLLNLLNVEPGSPLWDNPLYPLDLPIFETVEVDPVGALDLALENRPEIRQKEMELENARLSVGFNKDQLKPQLDLALNLTYGGLAGDEFANLTVDRDGDTMPDDLDGDGEITQNDLVRQQIGAAGFSDSYDQVLNQDFDTWSIALQFSYPIGNRAAKARLGNARLDYERVLVEMEQLLDNIRVEVRQAVRTLRSDRERVKAAQVSRRLREEQLDAERKKYEEGLSTNYQVLQFQRDLEDAQLSETRSVVDYSKSIVELKRITGNLLEDLGVQLVQPQATVGR